MKNKPLIPITAEVSVDSLLISAFAARAFPKISDFIVIVDKLTEEAFDEAYSARLSITENEKQIEIRYYQKLWDLILEKGRSNNV